MQLGKYTPLPIWKATSYSQPGIWQYLQIHNNANNGTVVKPSANGTYSCAGGNVIEEPWKATLELVFFNHLLHKICSTAARGKSSHFLQTFITPILGICSTNICEENLLQIQLQRNVTANAVTAKNTQWECFCNRFIAPFWIRYY